MSAVVERLRSLGLAELYDWEEEAQAVVAALPDLLAVVEAAEEVHAILHTEFSHSLAMRQLGKALRRLEREGLGMTGVPDRGEGRKPRLLDLFCGAGGAAMGYSRAGFEVVGVDIAPQPNYPFEFEQMDAVWFLRDMLKFPHHFDAIHASPPCQHFTKYRNAVKDIQERYEDLIEPTRDLIRATGLPYVIENVEGAPLEDPVMLCGSMFDLDVRRHRLFETNWPLEPPWRPCRHKLWAPRFKSATGRKPNSRLTIEVGSWDEPLERQKAAMGVDWKITTRELSEAIPPAYCEFIGARLLQHLRMEAVA